MSKRFCSRLSIRETPQQGPGALLGGGPLLVRAPPSGRIVRANRERRDRHEGEEQEKQGECDPSRFSAARGGKSFHRVSYTTNRSGPEQEAHRFPARPEGSVRDPCLLTTTVLQL